MLSRMADRVTAPNRRYLSTEDWRKAERAHDSALLADSFIRKAYAATVTKAADAAAGALTLDFVISTQDVDREQDTVAIAGWDVSNFLRNPVVLWAHSYGELPVAKALSVSQTPSALTSRAEFTSEDLYAFGYQVGRMYDAGFLNAVSVGFIPKKWSMVNDEQSGRHYAYDILEQELLEYSAVPVPANPNALQLAAAKGFDVRLIREWAEKFLDGVAGPGFWAPRELAERTFRALSGNGATIIMPEQRVATPAAVKTQLTVAGKRKGDEGGDEGDDEGDGTDTPPVPEDEASADHATRLKASYKALVSALKATAHVASMHGAHIDAAFDPPADDGASDQDNSDSGGKGIHLDALTLADVIAVLGAMTTTIKAQTKAGARHSAADVQLIQAIHDKALDLGAACKQVADEPVDESTGGNVIGAAAGDIDLAAIVDDDDIDLDAIVERAAADTDIVDLDGLDAADVAALVGGALKELTATGGR